MTSTLFDLYDRVVLRHPLTSLLAVIALTIAMAIGLPNFKLDASADSLTLEHDDDLNFFRGVVKRLWQRQLFNCDVFAPKRVICSIRKISTLSPRSARISPQLVALKASCRC